MFSGNEKRKIAQAVEDVIREIAHPEMDSAHIHFQLHIEGRESWSWADIRENSPSDPPNDSNSWNEVSRNILKDSGNVEA